MTSAEIIALFELYVDDTTELSTAEELALLNRVYQTVCDDRPWEFLKKEASGSMSTTTTIAVPSDFSQFLENRGYTDNSEVPDYDSTPTGILINGTKWLKAVDWSTRRQYANQDGYAYYDARQNTITATYPQPSGAAYSFDYKMVPTDLLIGTSPVFPSRFHPMLAYAMAVDDMIIQLFDKARSYAGENNAKYRAQLAQMALWNANLSQM